jgi:hypothetical protein
MKVFYKITKNIGNTNNFLLDIFKLKESIHFD